MQAIETYFIMFVNPITVLMAGAFIATIRDLSPKDMKVGACLLFASLICSIHLSH